MKIQLSQIRCFFLISIISLFATVKMVAQSDEGDDTKMEKDDEEEKIKLDFSAYIDTYIASDNDNSVGEIRQFTIISSAKKEFAINSAQFTGSANYKNFRSKITLHAGTIRESGWEGYTSYPLIQEAFVGTEIFKGLWFDAGYFVTHIGGEALLPKDNLLSLHTIMSFYEPFYQAGVRVSYEFSEKIKADLHLLNGFGIFDDNNSQKSLAWSLTYQPHENFNVYYSGILGNEQPSDKKHAIRNFHNLVFGFSPFKFLEGQFQLDYAVEENTKDNLDGTFSNAKFFGSFLTLKLKFNEKISFTTRGELFEDEDGLMGGSFNASDLTVGLEYKPNNNSFFRVEARSLKTDKQFKLFLDQDNNPTNKRNEVVFSMGFWID